MRLVALFGCLLLSAVAYAQRPLKKISIAHLTKNLYVCTSYGYLDNDEPFPANSLFAVTQKGVVLLDTPWGEEQTQELIDSVKQRFNKKIIFCIATHFHDDRTGGFALLRKHGAKTYTSKLTCSLSKRYNNKLSQYTFKNDTTFHIAGLTLQTYYPGKGHSPDNLVVWLPQTKTIMGGCLIKSTETAAIGFTRDADVKHWPLAIKNVAHKFPTAKYVIPGHQGWQGGIKQFDHTLRIIAAK